MFKQKEDGIIAILFLSWPELRQFRDENTAKGENSVPLVSCEACGSIYYLAEAGRKILLKEWNRRRWQEIEVPEPGQKIPQGLLPHLAAKNWPPICGANCLHTSRFDGGELR